MELSSNVLINNIIFSKPKDFATVCQRYFPCGCRLSKINKIDHKISLKKISHYSFYRSVLVRKQEVFLILPRNFGFQEGRKIWNNNSRDVSNKIWWHWTFQLSELSNVRWCIGNNQVNTSTFPPENMSTIPKVLCFIHCILYLNSSTWPRRTLHIHDTKFLYHFTTIYTFINLQT